MDKLTFYFDRNFGRRLPEALWRADAPFNVEFHHNEKNRFPPNITDDEWLKIVGSKGWFAFSHDRKWHREEPALSAIKQYKIGCFYLWGAEESAWSKVCFFVRHSEKIVEVAAKTPRPFVFHVAKDGSLERVDLDEVKIPDTGGAESPMRAVHSGGKGARR